MMIQDVIGDVKGDQSPDRITSERLWGIKLLELFSHGCQICWGRRGSMNVIVVPELDKLPCLFRILCIQVGLNLSAGCLEAGVTILVIFLAGGLAELA